MDFMAAAWADLKAASAIVPGAEFCAPLAFLQTHDLQARALEVGQ